MGDPAFGGERHPLYRLSKSDTVDVNFTFSPDFNQTLTVQPDGFVALKGAGTLLAEGLTIPQMQQAIAYAYRGFLHQPEVTVTLKDFDKPYFLASGEVARPGKYELRGDLTVNEAVAIAGGFTQQARHSQVVLFRRISAYVAESHVIDVKKMLNSHDLREDLHLQPGRLYLCSAEPYFKDPQVCSHQRHELVHEPNAVLAERSGSVHFSPPKSGRFPQISPGLVVRCVTHVHGIERKLENRAISNPPRARGHLVPASTARRRFFWICSAGDDAFRRLLGAI